MERARVSRQRRAQRAGSRGDESEEGRRPRLIRRGEGHGRRNAARDPKWRSALQEGHRGSQRRASRQGEGAFTRELAERTTGGVALPLPEGMRVTGRVVPQGAQAILKSGLSVRDMRGVSQGGPRQQDLQSQRQGEKHNRDRVASHPFSSPKLWPARAAVRLARQHQRNSAPVLFF